MTPAELQAELFGMMDKPFTGEDLFDCLSDAVFFIKNERCQYVVVNRALVERCGLHEKREIIGRTPDEVYPAPLGLNYREQDKKVLDTGEPILNQLELHLYPSGRKGWCLTNKVPMHGTHERVIGIVGISKDLEFGRGSSEGFQKISKAVQHIQQFYVESLRINSLAEMSGLSVYQFEQRIRAVFQVTAGQYIQKVRMEAAMRRLRESQDSLAQVAVECGYSDQSAFSRQFRLTVGLSPGQYRKAFAGEKETD